MACLISQAQVSWGKLLTKRRYDKMVVNTGKNIIYVDGDENNAGVYEYPTKQMERTLSYTSSE